MFCLAQCHRSTQAAISEATVGPQVRGHGADRRPLVAVTLPVTMLLKTTSGR
jgi:hypothetical protein